jgi:hypothetical protein
MNGTNRRMVKPMTIILIGAIIVVIGGITGAIGTYLHNKRSSAKTDKIMSIQNELIEKSEKLIDTQNELLKYTSGGDSFGEVQLLRISDGSGGHHYTFYFKKQGEYPLYNVSLTALDRNSLDKDRLKRNNNEATLNDLINYKSFELGDISNVEGGINFGSLMTLKNGNIYDYLFTVTTRNKTFYQELKFQVRDNKLVIAMRIKDRDKDGNTKTLVDRADEEFPGTKEGKIKWD